MYVMSFKKIKIKTSVLYMTVKRLKGKDPAKPGFDDLVLCLDDPLRSPAELLLTNVVFEYCR